jgi:hypothetical protein
VLIIRCLVRIRPKFRRHNPDILICTILSAQSNNNEVMLLKFYLNPNLMSYHKHVLSVTLEHVVTLICSRSTLFFLALIKLRLKPCPFEFDVAALCSLFWLMHYLPAANIIVFAVFLKIKQQIN